MRDFCSQDKPCNQYSNAASLCPLTMGRDWSSQNVDCTVRLGYKNRVFLRNSSYSMYGKVRYHTFPLMCARNGIGIYQQPEGLTGSYTYRCAQAECILLGLRNIEGKGQLTKPKTLMSRKLVGRILQCDGTYNTIFTVG